MSESPEVKAAQENLDEAVQRMHRALGSDGGSLFVDYVLIIEGSKLDEEGHGITVVDTVFRGGEMRLTTALGLMDLGYDRVKDGSEKED